MGFEPVPFSVCEQVDFEVLFIPNEHRQLVPRRCLGHAEWASQGILVVWNRGREITFEKVRYLTFYSEAILGRRAG